MLPKQSRIPLPAQSKSREVRKLEGQRDRALGRLHKLKATGRQKKAKRRRQTLAWQVVNLTRKTTQDVIDGET